MPRPNKLTADQRATAEKAILARMYDGSSFSFADLYKAGDAAAGCEYQGTYRLADRLIQRERKAGRIYQRSFGQWFAEQAA